MKCLFFTILFCYTIFYSEVIFMIVKKKPMSLCHKIFCILSFVFLIGAFIFLGTRDYNIRELSNSELFNKEYKTIDAQHHFEVLNSYETLTFLENGTGVLFLGFPQNKWCVSMAEILDEVSREVNYGPIYYFNFYDERESRHDNYLGIIREMDEYLVKDDKGIINIYAPTIVAVVKGEVVFFDNETSFMNQTLEPKDYWTISQKEKKKEEFISVFHSLKEVAS